MSTIPLSGAEAFLYAEARALDDRDWDTWLAFYAPDASFWMPAWDDNDRLALLWQIITNGKVIGFPNPVFQ